MKEHTLEWRKDFKGPVEYKKGDIITSTVKSKVAKLTEFFVLQVPKNHEKFPELNEEYKQVFNQDWDGSYLVPCRYIKFSEQSKKETT